MKSEKERTEHTRTKSGEQNMDSLSPKSNRTIGISLPGHNLLWYDETVKSVMGGKVLEHEAKTILREGWKQGRKEGEDYGIKKGKTEQAKQTAFNLKAMGMSDESIAMAVEVGVSVVREWFG